MHGHSILQREWVLVERANYASLLLKPGHLVVLIASSEQWQRLVELDEKRDLESYRKDDVSGPPVKSPEKLAQGARVALIDQQILECGQLRKGLFDPVGHNVRGHEQGSSGTEMVPSSLRPNRSGLR